MSDVDLLQRFLFENADLRGVLVRLEESYQETLSRHSYPTPLRALLGEMLAAVGLLSSTLKFEGRLSLQAVGKGDVRLLMAECNHQRDLRAIARWQGEPAEGLALPELLTGGQLVITIEPDQGKRYQGIVPLEAPDLAGCLEGYFEHSEQLATRIRLEADGRRAAGFLLQAIPGDGGSGSRSRDSDDWDRITALGATLTRQELLELDNEPLLYRLFHEEQVRLYDPEPLRFGCDCSRERSLNALRALPPAELNELISERGAIELNCQFCNQQYRFDAIDIEALLSDGGMDGGEGQTLH